MTSSFELVISDLATVDLKGLHQYGIETWGQEQANQYLNAITHSLMLLTDFPRRGKAAPNMPPGVRQLIIGQHLALYQVAARQVIILRAVSPRMSLPYELDITGGSS